MEHLKEISQKPQIRRFEADFSLKNVHKDVTKYLLLRGESYIDFDPHGWEEGWGGGRWVAMTNDVLKFRKVFEFESSCIVICFSYIYLIINGKR